MKLLKSLYQEVDFKSILAAYTTHTLIVFGSIFFLADFFPKNQFEGFINPSLDHSPFFIKQLLTWDAHWFTYVAETGYTEKTTVFLPLLIILIKALSLTGLSIGLCGFILCNIFTYFSFLIFYKLGRLHFTEVETKRALLAYAVFPTSFFLNSIYSESLFLFLSFFCIYASQQNKHELAGITGTLATLTRNLGIILFLLIGYHIWKDLQKNRKWHGSMLSIFLLPIALITYMIYNAFLFDNPIAFINSQKLWGRSFSWPSENIWRAFIIFRWDLLNGLNPLYYGNHLSFVLTSLSIATMLVLSLTFKERLPLSYLLVGWLWLLIPLFSAVMPFQPLYSLSRFALIVFSNYLFWSKFHMPVLYNCYIACSSILLAVSVCLFVNGWWVG